MGTMINLVTVCDLTLCFDNISHSMVCLYDLLNCDENSNT